MKTKKHYTHVTKRIFRPEVTHCLKCQSKLKRCRTISQKTIVTFEEIIRLVHNGYKCPKDDCEGKDLLYRSIQADALSLSGFTYGMDVVLEVGHLRLSDHRTVDEIHQHLLRRLAPLEQTIARREILYLFEAYIALLRAGTDVAHDSAWRKQAEENGGILLSIDGIQPDAGNETIYLVRDVLTGRILNAENTTESTKNRLMEILLPVVALEVPVIGVISDAQLTELQAVAELWPTIPHQVCQFHALGDAGRLIYQADIRARNEMRHDMKEKTQRYRRTVHGHLRQMEQQGSKDEQEMERLHILDEYAATVEGVLQIGSKAPFEYGGLATHEALIQLAESLEHLKKKTP